MALDTFFPVSNTFTLDVTATSQAIVPVITPAPAAADIQCGGFEYRFTNVGTQVVWLASADPSAAAPSAIVPGSGGNTYALPILPNTTATLKFVYGTKLAVIAPATGSTIHVIIGRGVNM